MFCRGLPVRAQASASAPDTQALSRLAALEARHGGRLGVVALDTVSGRRVGYRADERFAMCSTHKFVSAAAVLTLVDQGHMSLDKRVPYTRADLLDYAPITKEGVTWSDNTAANLLLGLLDGPSAGPARFARSGTPSPGSTVPSRT
jgi:beta-lactamase class A